MKRMNYKAINVKQLNWTNLQSKFKNQSVIFSVDVAKTDFVGLIETEDQSFHQLIKWRHPQDTEGLINKLCNELEVNRLCVVMEPTGTYGDALRWQFVKRGISVYRVNPKHTHDQSEIFDGVPSSHDAKAAYIIADLHRHHHSKVWREMNEEQRNLHALINELEIHQRIHKDNMNRLLALLVRHWPELEGIMDVNTVSVLTLLSHYGSPESVYAQSEQAEQILHQVGRSLKISRCQAITQSAGSTIGMPCTTCEKRYIQQLATDLLRTYKEIKAIEKSLSEQLKVHVEQKILSQFCGKVTYAVLYVILGDLRQYPNAKSLLKAIGLNLKEHSSGQKKGRLSITKRGSRKVRFYLYWKVLRLIKTDSHVKAWYQRKVLRDGNRERGNGRAIIAVMRKVVKALWHVARGEAFDSRKLFNLGEVGI